MKQKKLKLYNNKLTNKITKKLTNKKTKEREYNK